MSGREGRSLTRTDRQLGAVALVSGAGLFAAVVYQSLRPLSLGGDSGALVRGARGIVDCLRRSRFTHCERFVVHQPTGAHAVIVGQFALLQYVPAVALRSVDVSVASTLRALVLLNVASLVAIVALAHVTLKRLVRSLWAPLVTAALIASPLIWYGRVALSEELSAVVILAAIAAALLDARPLIIGTLVAWACITKETNPPFILALALICVLGRPIEADAKRRWELIAIVAGTGIGIALNAGFNIFRYGTMSNGLYSKSYYYVTDGGSVARSFATQWLAPNGGLAWFWPLAPVIVFAVAIAGLRRGRPMSWPRIAVPIVALLFVGQVALLAVWWTPFGWYAWGPRLVLPLIPALLVAACALGADDASTFVARFLAGRWLFPAGLAIIVIGLPQAVVLFHGSAPTQFFAHPVCQNISLIKNPTQFSACFVRTAWWKHPWMLQLGMRGLATRDGWLVAIAFATTITTLLAMARRAAREFMRGCMPAAGEIPTAVTRSS